MHVCMYVVQANNTNNKKKLKKKKSTKKITYNILHLGAHYANILYIYYIDVWNGRLVHIFLHRKVSSKHTQFEIQNSQIHIKYNRTTHNFYRKNSFLTTISCFLYNAVYGTIVYAKSKKKKYIISKGFIQIIKG